MIRQWMANISACAIAASKEIHVDTWVASVCVISILIISILPASICRSESEIYLCFLIPTIATIGLLTAFIKKIVLRFSWIDGIVIGWYAYTMCRLWFDATYPAAGFAIKATLMCILYVAIRILLSGCRMPGNAIATLIILFAVVEAGMGYSQIISGTSRHHLYPVTGSFLNPGPYSVYLELGIVALCAFRKFDNINHIIMLLLAVPLLMTMSRAAFLAIFVCLVLLFHNSIKGWRIWGILMVLTTTCAVCLYFLKSGSADGRGIINYIGFHCFLDNLFFGSGIGSFFNRYALKTAEISMHMPEINLNSVDVIDFAFNDLLLVGVEQGLVGLAFVIALIIFVLYRLWVKSRPLFLVVLSLLIISLFSYPFELLPYQIIAIIATAYAAINQETTNAHNCYSMFYAIFKIITVMTCICSISYICYNRVGERWEAEKDYLKFVGIQDKAFTKDYYSLLPYLQDNKYFLFDFAKMLSEQRRYNDSNDMLRRGALISNDPMFLVLQGNNYRDMEALELAEKTYLQAWHSMPNRIYPLYRIMKLHYDWGSKDKAIVYAKKVIGFNEKIPSPAVNDMKREASEIINLSQTKKHFMK